MSNACGYTPSAGAQMMRLDEPTGIWETIGGILEFPALTITAGTAQCNDFDSGATGFAEYFKNGQFTVSDLTFTLGLIAGNPVHEKLYEDLIRVGNESTGEKEAVNFRILLPTDTVTTFEFRSLVIVWGVTVPAANSDDNKLTTPITLKPTGEPQRIV